MVSGHRATWTALVAVLPFAVLPSCDSDTAKPSEDAPASEEPGDSGAPGSPETDVDGDGATADVDCDDADPTVHPGAVEICDGRDEDCDGLVDEDAVDAVRAWLDEDGDAVGRIDDGVMLCLGPDTLGYVTSTRDCDDSDNSVYPGADEHCDARDEDCDGLVDEDAVDRSMWYADADGDGRGAGPPTEACAPPADTVLLDGDCDDTDAARSPSHLEDCDPRTGLDEDCDGLVDCEDAECAGTSTCVEQDCADGLDSDLDGTADCLDDDCWAEPACRASEVRITGGTMRHSLSRHEGGTDEVWTATAITGTASRRSPSGGWSSCAFSIAAASASAVPISPQLGAVHRSITLSSGCTFSPGAVLPPVLGNWNLRGQVLWGVWRPSSAPWSPSASYSSAIKVAMPLYESRSLVGSGSSVEDGRTYSGHGMVTWNTWRTYGLGGSVMTLPPETVGTHPNSWW